MAGGARLWLYGVLLGRACFDGEYIFVDGQGFSVGYFFFDKKRRESERTL